MRTILTGWKLLLLGAPLAIVIAVAALVIGGTTAPETAHGGGGTDTTGVTCADVYLGELQQNVDANPNKPIEPGDLPVGATSVAISITYTQHNTTTDLTHAVTTTYNGGIPGVIAGTLSFPTTERCATVDKTVTTSISDNPANPTDPVTLSVTEAANAPLVGMIVYWDSDNPNQAGFYHVDAAAGGGSVTLTRIVDGACNGVPGTNATAPGNLFSCIPTNKGLNTLAYLNGNIVKAAALTGVVPRTPATQCPVFGAIPEDGSCYNQGTGVGASSSCAGSTGNVEGAGQNPWTRTDIRTGTKIGTSEKVPSYGVAQLFNPTDPKTCANNANTNRSSNYTVVWSLDSATTDGDEVTGTWDSDYDKDGCLDWQEANSPLPVYVNAPPIANVDAAIGGRDPFNPFDCDRNLGGIWSFEVAAVPVTQDVNNVRISGTYFHCRVHVIHNNKNAGNDLAGKMLCYVDAAAIDVNSDNDPGLAGDGFTGSPFPIAAAAPPPPYADVPSAGHAALTGSLNKATDTFELEGCAPTASAQVGPFIYYRFTDIDGRSGDGTAEIWTQQTNCIKPTGAPTYTSNVNVVQHASKATENNFDFDLDGCADRNELGDSANTGGLRDPSNPFDRQDINKDGFIDIPTDILGVASNFGPVPPNDPAADRNITMTGNAGTWNRDGQDGVVTIPDDILGTAAQFGHNCI